MHVALGLVDHQEFMTLLLMIDHEKVNRVAIRGIRIDMGRARYGSDKKFMKPNPTYLLNRLKFKYELLFIK